ncbi:putative integral membrane cytochrome D ubiquinol oxidase subunit I CydA [Kineosporia sp. NBRC 101677]|uniref:cytochrome ubiquinol oxidase subunit I n=1 Tax=Kineosporia sp. NBRC 101677 TaxID=3032197 RepID=UPI0024A25641|nr:cytochrome ubiquinol oxidase subunit I [Kineosporia sp. NBRC 101677]GLY17464.1 putative integral membrane cytochrome D ubiquinol oxidase subunit I CydA [Kineosporia sp. NBRC 101677]
MDALDLARWQFGVTTVYHFIFVPLTIGLAPMVAIMQTLWLRSGDERWLRMTKFFGKLFLINFAIGVVTGIVQEFQFGMNWSEYSRFVGDVFGAPLAMEGLAAFFLESTFIGAWIFGWGRLPARVHLAAIWLAAIGVNLSAFFILAANSFMQHPVGVELNPETGRAELTSIFDLLTNSTVLWAFPHQITAAWMTAATFVAGIAGWWMVRDRASNLYRPVFRLASVVLLIAGIGVAITGDGQAKLMFEQQPMKMAAAEGLCETEDSAGFSLFAIGNPGPGHCDVWAVSIPGVYSYLATGDFGATVDGVNDLQAEYSEKYGDGRDYVPNLASTYWNFRLMIGFGLVAAAFGTVGLWVTRRDRTPGRWFARFALVAVPAPFLANLTGWIFTEMGRQPWVVAPAPDGDPAIRMLTEDGVSMIGPWTVGTSLTVFTLLYGGLAVVWFGLIRRYAAAGAPEVDSPDEHDDDADRPLSFAY